jgi:phosphoribosylanthranilate isomerase
MSLVKVKICGITNVADAAVCLAEGADAVGMVFYEPSPRHLSDLGLANEIAQVVGPFVNVVGLFVDAQQAYIERVLSHVSIDCLQFHGDETAQYCEQFARPYIKALRVKDGIDLVEQAATYNSARGILLDTYRPGVPGGTGETFDWQRVPESISNLVLAGGLDATNVAEAIRTTRPYAVDVSGGVEASKGIKDAQKIQAFIRNAKGKQ